MTENRRMCSRKKAIRYPGSQAHTSDTEPHDYRELSAGERQSLYVPRILFESSAPKDTLFRVGCGGSVRYGAEDITAA